MKTFKLALVAAAIAAVAQGVSAQSAMATNSYLSLSAGPSKFSVDCVGTSTCDDSSTAVKLLYGYKFTPNIAIEASVGTVGKTTATLPAGVRQANLSVKGQYVGVGVAGLLPFGTNNDWTGIARVGANYMNTKVDLGGVVSGSDSDKKTQIYAGLGLNYAFTSAFDLGLAWDTTRVEYAGSKSTVNAYSLVGTFKF